MPPALEDYKPTGTGEPPLARAKEWVRYSEKAVRETNTMPQWAGSCWYYLRFCDPHNDHRFVGKEAEGYWLGGDKPGGVDLYVGGTEHAVLHLLYARFWQKVLFDLGYVSKPEPFQRLVNQGIILGEDNQKMSKSRGNIVNPDDVIEQHGADAFRCYEMFMGPLEQMKPWSMRGVEGVARFLSRVWRLFMTENQRGEWELSAKLKNTDSDKAQKKLLHAAIKKVTEDIESFSFNTAISQMMIFVNAFTNVDVIPLSAMRSFLILLNPFAPHIASELWERLNAKFTDAHGDITEQSWPTYDERLLVEQEVEIVIQINGKLRDRMKMPVLATEEELKTAALSNQKIQDRIAGKNIRKVIVVPRKLVNIVVMIREMLKEFKEFAVKGNAVDLAVGVIIGAAFGGIIGSLVKDIVMPPLGFFTGGLDFSNKFVVLEAAKDGSTFATPADAAKAGAVTWNYGNFITLMINFIIVALAIFIIVKGVNRMKRPTPTADPVSKECPACAMTIPIKATRCPHCTSELSQAGHALAP